MLQSLRHLLPDSTAWRVIKDRLLRQYLSGLSSVGTAAVADVDDVSDDLWPETTRELAEWEGVFGLDGVGTEAARRLELAGAWAATGGQSPGYIQQVLQAAGWDVYVYDWFEPVTFGTRNPLVYTNQPTIGTNQCGDTDAQCGEEPPEQKSVDSIVCNRFLANEIHYIVNKDLTLNAPDPIPTDTAAWPYFWYVGGTPFGTVVNIPVEDRDRFERLLLRLGPAHLWIVTLVNYN